MRDSPRKGALTIPRQLFVPIRAKSAPRTTQDAGMEHARSHRRYAGNRSGFGAARAACQRVVPLKDGTFAVEIVVTGTRPTIAARAYATEAEAEAWIERQKLK